MARAMVLCAGLGTRLRPLTDELPKPLVPIGDRSILSHIAHCLARAGLSELVLNTHHLPEKFDNEIRSLPLEVQRVHEPVIRGTAGGIAGARHLLDAPPIVAWNGDIWVDPPLGALLAAAAAAPLVLAVAPREKGEGVVGLGASGEVVRLRGQVFGVERSGADYVGVCALGARTLERLPETGCLIGDVALPMLREGMRIITLPARGTWSDVGTIETYLDANLRWLVEQGSDESFVGPSAEIGAGVELVRSVVGAGARISGAGEVQGSVIWPGASARAPLDGVVVMSSGRVVACRR